MILLKSTSDRTAMWHSLPTEKLVDIRKRWMDQFSPPYPLRKTVSVTRIARRDLGR
jgi:hypothetical protein